MPTPIADAFVALRLDPSSFRGELERAVNAAVGAVKATVDVLADTQAVPSAINRAIEAADTNIAVTAATETIAPEISGAVDAADTRVTVTGDATPLTSEVTGAVDAADTHVAVTGQVNPQLQASLDKAGDSAKRTSDSMGLLKGAIAAIGTGAVLGGIKNAIDAASDLEESTSKATQVFGDGIGIIEEFGDTAATAVGLSKQEALEATATFGNLFQSLGSTRDEATRLAPEIVQLGADLASFNNLATADALDKLRSGLVGEIEPLRQLGVSFGEAEVQAKAVELGLAAAGAELTEGAKLQARYALIVEQTSLAQGDFARTSEGLANQQRTLRGEFLNVVAAIGEGLQPVALELVGTVRELMPQFQSLAADVVPLLASVLRSAGPAAEGFLTGLEAVIPVLTVVANVIDAIPAPVLSMAATFATLNATLSPLRAGLNLLSANFGAVSGAVSLLNPIITAAVVGFTVFTAIQGQNAEKQRENAERTREARQALDDLTSSVRNSAEAFIEAQDESGQLASFLTDASAGFDDFADVVAQGPQAVEEFRRSLIAARGGLDDIGLTGLVASGRFTELSNSLQEAAEQSLITAVAQGTLNQGQLDSLTATNTAADGTVNYIAILEDLREEIEKGEAAARLSANVSQVMAQALLDAGTNAAIAFEDFGRITDAIDNFVSSATDALPTIGDAFSDALKIGQEAAKANADAIIEEAQRAVEGARESGDELAIVQAETALEAAEAQAAAITQGGVVTAAAFKAVLEAQTATLVTFRDNLSILTAAGFAGLAATIAEQGPQVGGALAEELATALEAGNTEIVQGVETATTAFETEWTNTVAFFRDTLGPEFILASGLLGQGAAEAFGKNLSFGERARIATELAKTTLDVQGQAIAAVAAVEGALAAEAYGQALGLDDETIDAAIAAGEAIKNNVPLGQARLGGISTGQAFGHGIADGIEQTIGGIIGAAVAAVNQAARAARNAAEAQSPSKLFADQVGIPIGQGIALGIEQSTAAIVRASAAAVSAAAGAGNDFTFPATASAVGSLAGGNIEGAAATVHIGAGAFVIQFSGVTPSRAEALSTGQLVGQGVLDVLAARGVRFSGRVARRG